jgi:TatD DNase family protein
VLIDSHCHIAGPEFASDLDQVIQRARAAGLGRAFVILAADDEPELRQAEEVRSRWPEVRFSISRSRGQ